MRGTSGELRHPRLTRYRCSLPGLAGFAGPRCTEPEVPRSGARALSRGRGKILTYSFTSRVQVEPTSSAVLFHFLRARFQGLQLRTYDLQLRTEFLRTSASPLLLEHLAAALPMDSPNSL